MKPLVVRTMVCAAVYGIIYFSLRDALPAYDGAIMAQADSPPPDVIPAADIASPFASSFISNAVDWKSAMRAPVVKFTIDPNRDNTLNGPAGTVIRIPAGTLANSRNQLPRGNVVVELRECYDLPAILADKLTTTSDGRLIETAGMVEIRASSGGKELKVKDGASYEIMFPRNEKGGMQLFYGDRDQEGNINWRVAADANGEMVFAQQTISGETGAGVTNAQAGNGLDENYFAEITNSELRMGFKRSSNQHHLLKLRNSSQTVQSYFASNFNPDAAVLKTFCENRLQSEITMVLDASGRVQQSYISSASLPAFDEMLLTFICNMPPVDLKSLKMNYSESNALVLRVGNPPRMENKALEQQVQFNQKFRKKNAARWNQELATADASELNYFIFTATELGWINCDRFIDVEGPRVDMVVQTDMPDSCAVYLVFNRWCSILQGSLQDGQFVFSGIPANEKVDVYSVSCVNRLPRLSAAAAQVSEKPLVLNDYRPFSLSDLEDKLYLN